MQSVARDPAPAVAVMAQGILSSVGAKLPSAVEFQARYNGLSQADYTLLQSKPVVGTLHSRSRTLQNRRVGGINRTSVRFNCIGNMIPAVRKNFIDFLRGVTGASAAMAPSHIVRWYKKYFVETEHGNYFTLNNLLPTQDVPSYDVAVMKRLSSDYLKVRANTSTQ